MAFSLCDGAECVVQTLALESDGSVQLVGANLHEARFFRLLDGPHARFGGLLIPW